MADQDPPAPPAGGGDSATAEKAPPKKAKPAAKPRKDGKTGRLPPYNVVLLDDDHHTCAYVIEMLGALFGIDPVKAFKMAEEVDSHGRVIVLTTHKEKAELKRDQITAYGADARMASSQGSMSAVIEPAQG
jgi:ATP-dependent Clp protease adaptor protein ClpS